MTLMDKIPICKNCQQLLSSHASDARCLFAPTRFEKGTYEDVIAHLLSHSDYKTLEADPLKFPPVPEEPAE